MNSRIKQSIAEKIDNPLVLRWVIGRLEHLNETDPERAKEFEDEVFNDIALRRVIGCREDYILASVFRTLRPEKFANAITDISKNWAEWDDVAASWSAPVIARLQPGNFPALADSFFNTDHPFDDFNKTYGAIGALKHAEPSAARDCLGRVVKRFLRTRQQSIAEMYVGCLTESAICLKMPEAWNLIEWAFSGIEDDNRVEAYLGTVYWAIAGDFPYYELALRRITGNAATRFGDMQHLFNDPEVSAALDGILNKKSRKAVSEIKALLRDLPLPEDASEFDPLPFAKRFSESYEFPKARLQMHLAFIAALIACGNSRSSIDVSSLLPEEAVKILSLDLVSLPENDAVVENLRTGDRNRVVELMIEYLQTSKNTYGESGILSAMGDLGYVEFIPHLIKCTGGDSSDWACDSASRALSKIGEPAAEEIAAGWKTLDRFQKIYCIELLRYLDCAAAVDLLAGIFDECRAEGLDDWCNAAKTLPDERFVELLKPELKRELPEVDSAYLTVCELLSLDTEDIGAVRNRVNERQKESARREKALKFGTWEDLQSKTLRIKLKCPLCRNVNTYDVGTIICDPDNKDIKPFIGDELTCLSCEKTAEMEISKEGYLSVSAEAFKMLGTIESGGEYEGPLKYAYATKVDGKLLPMGDTIEYYKGKIESNPSDTESLLALGNCFNTTGRLERAEKCYRDCLRVDPRCAEAWVSLATLLNEQDEFYECFKCLEQGLAYRDSWIFYRLQHMTPAQFVASYEEFYYMVGNFLGETDAPAAPSAFLSKRKIGRNEPCPCGSGKKYKKCCLGKE